MSLILSDFLESAKNFEVRVKLTKPIMLKTPSAKLSSMTSLFPKPN